MSFHFRVRAGVGGAGPGRVHRRQALDVVRGQRLRNIVCVEERGFADLDQVTLTQCRRASNLFSVDVRAVAASQIANQPAAWTKKDLAVATAAAVVVHSDLIGRFAADRQAAPLDQAVHAAPLVPSAEDDVHAVKLVGMSFVALHLGEALLLAVFLAPNLSAPEKPLDSVKVSLTSA